MNMHVGIFLADHPPQQDTIALGDESIPLPAQYQHRALNLTQPIIRSLLTVIKSIPPHHRRSPRRGLVRAPCLQGSLLRVLRPEEADSTAVICAIKPSMQNPQVVDLFEAEYEDECDDISGPKLGGWT